ncbi:MAG TPA: IS1380 family transposase [Gammaproteobacteria bacterium]|nr:IS1380 family transposase [Gammaproteobacteria bacterium]
MSESVPLPTPGFNKSLRVEARGDRLTGDAGFVVLRQILDNTRAVDTVAAGIADPRDPAHVTHSLPELLRTQLLLKAQGWGRGSDADDLRNDPAICLAAADARGPGAADRPLPSQPTLSRLLGVLAAPAHRRALGDGLIALAGARLRASRRGHRHRRLTIDIDGLPIPVHGQQPGSAWNGHYRERIYYPLIAACAETGDMLGAVLRPGNAGAAEGADSFIRAVVDRAEAELCQVALVRMDAGFPGEPLLADLERNGTPYVARLRGNAVLDRLAAPFLRRPRGRRPAKPRHWCREVSYQAGSWSRVRRVVLVVKERSDDRQLEHFFLVTSIAAAERDADSLLALYRQRGTAEGHLGELMDVLDPALSSTPRPNRRHAGQPVRPAAADRDPAAAAAAAAAAAEAFGRNEAQLLLHLLAYELAHVARHALETVTGTGWSLKRTRRAMLNVGGRLIRSGRRLILAIEAGCAGLWDRVWRRIQQWPWAPAAP